MKSVSQFGVSTAVGRKKSISDACLHVADLIVDDLLTHRDGERFRQSAVHLPLDDHRVDARAAIVQRIEAADFGDTCIDIDIEDADIGAEGIGHVRRIVVGNRLQTGLQPRNCLIVGGKGDFRHGLEPLRIALHLEAVDLPFQIAVMDLQKVCGDHLRLGADFPPGHRGCGTRDRSGPRPVGAKPVGSCIGVAFLHGDIVRRQADLGRQDLREGRGVALALTDGAEARDCRSGRMDADFAGIEHAEAENVAVLDRPGADDLGEEGDADAHQAARLAPGEGFPVGFLLGAKGGVVDRLQRLAHGGFDNRLNRIPSRAPRCRGTAPCR